jgi:hypothetical protein
LFARGWRMTEDSKHTVLGVARDAVLVAVLALAEARNDKELDKYGSTVLQTIVQGNHRAQFQHIRMIVKAAPKLAKAVDCQGRTPLSLACGGSGEEIIKVLYDAYPEAASIPTKHGTPLHKLCACKVSEEKEVLPLVSFLLEVYPNAVRIRTNAGRTVLELVSRPRKMTTIEMITEIEQTTYRFACLYGYCSFDARGNTSVVGKPSFSSTGLLNAIRYRLFSVKRQSCRLLKDLLYIALWPGDGLLGCSQSSTNK